MTDATGSSARASTERFRDCPRRPDPLLRGRRGAAAPARSTASAARPGTSTELAPLLPGRRVLDPGSAGSRRLGAAARADDRRLRRRASPGCSTGADGGRRPLAGRRRRRCGSPSATLTSSRRSSSPRRPGSRARSRRSELDDRAGRRSSSPAGSPGARASGSPARRGYGARLRPVRGRESDCARASAPVHGFLRGVAAAHRRARRRARARRTTIRAAILDRVRCPALVLFGARDRQVPLEDGFEYARRLHAPLRVIADCGHLLIGERPGRLRPRDARFLWLPLPCSPSRGVAQPGSALRSGRRGPQFESGHPDEKPAPGGLFSCPAFPRGRRADTPRKEIPDMTGSDSREHGDAAELDARPDPLDRGIPRQARIGDLIAVKGHFDRFAGSYTIAPDGGEIVLTIDADSLETGNATRDKHLRSAEFFDVAEHPETRFRSTSVTEGGDGNLRVSGELEAAGRTVAARVRRDPAPRRRRAGGRSDDDRGPSAPWHALESVRHPPSAREAARAGPPRVSAPGRPQTGGASGA